MIYVGWTKQFPGAMAPKAKPVQAMVGVSRDGGRTFAPPIRLPDGAYTPPLLEAARASAPGSPADAYVRANFGGDRLTFAVDDDGTAYAVWMSASANITPRPAPAPSCRSRPTRAGRGRPPRSPPSTSPMDARA